MSTPEQTAQLAQLAELVQVAARLGARAGLVESTLTFALDAIEAGKPAQAALNVRRAQTRMRELRHELANDLERMAGWLKHPEQDPDDRTGGDRRGH